MFLVALYVYMCVRVRMFAVCMCVRMCLLSFLCVCPRRVRVCLCCAHVVCFSRAQVRPVVIDTATEDPSVHQEAARAVLGEPSFLSHPLKFFPVRSLGSLHPFHSFLHAFPLTFLRVSALPHFSFSSFFESPSQEKKRKLPISFFLLCFSWEWEGACEEGERERRESWETERARETETKGESTSLVLFLREQPVQFVSYSVYLSYFLRFPWTQGKKCNTKILTSNDKMCE